MKRLIKKSPLILSFLLTFFFTTAALAWCPAPRPYCPPPPPPPPHFRPMPHHYHYGFYGGPAGSWTAGFTTGVIIGVAAICPRSNPRPSYTPLGPTTPPLIYHKF